MNDTMKALLQLYRSNHREDLIPCMQQFQDTLGHMSEEAIEAIGAYFGLPATKVYGIATFYDYFSFSPVAGEVVRICNGTSCHMQGAGRLLKEAEKSIQQIHNQSRTRVTVKLCECQGACSAGPIMTVNSTTYTRVSPDQVKQHITRALEKEKGERNA
jgi:NADH-quinone oxidoreductase subunit E